MEKPSVVVIGGGTGTHTVLKGLRTYADQIDITAVISMADSGGSTGRLRDEFGQLPVGDVRMALAALARDYSGHEELLRELFLYRFEQGEGLSGHNFGNLLLTALTDILGGEAEAVKAAGRILRIQGRVLPVTLDDTHLVATYDDGVTVTGEHYIDDPAEDRYGKHIVELRTEPAVSINPEAREALLQADLIIIGPGDLYSSLLASLVVAGVAEAIGQSAGRVVYIGNLMERIGQTEGMTIADCYHELTTYLAREPDVVLVNDAPLPETVTQRYAETEGTKPTVDDADQLMSRIVRTDLLQQTVVEKSAGDTLTRSLIRHDSDKLAKTIFSLLVSSEQ